jgi:UDP-glucose 4-epimerase
MTLPLVWVVGAGGLLGSSVLRELGPNAFCFSQSFSWGDRQLLRAELLEALAQFTRELTGQPERAWSIAWCAGAGVVATPAAALAAETETFRDFLQALSAAPALRSAQGSVLLASSAGGVHGGTLACPITEATAATPSSPYGQAKLMQEEILLSWAKAQPKPVSTLVARFSNLYGPGQRLEKPQGLISNLSRCLIHGVPAHIYVSLDTIRDYLFVEDAGRRFVAGMVRLAREATQAGEHVTKLYASEREISIAGLLGVFRQIARRRLRVVSGLHAVGSLQPRRLQFRSHVWAEAGQHVELIEGVSRVYQHQLAMLRQGRLPAPALVRR